MTGRIYDPALARFLTPDPVVSMRSPSQSWNRYAYAENSPLRFTDPTGFYGEDGSAAAAAAAAAAGAAAGQAAAAAYQQAYAQMSGYTWYTPEAAAWASSGPIDLNLNPGSFSGSYGTASGWAAVGSFDEAGGTSAGARSQGGGQQGGADEEVREFGASARDSIARENYQFAIANMDAAGELGGPALGADGQPLRTAWTFQVTASVNINIGPVNINYSVGLAGDSNGGLAVMRTGGAGGGAGTGGSAGVGLDVSNGASVDDLAGPFATTQTSAGLGPSASASGYTGAGSQGQPIAGTGWSVGAGAGGGTYSGWSTTKVVLRIW